MPGALVLVTGVSGVGKTHTVRELLLERACAEAISASAILKSRKLPTSHLDKGTAAENQRVIAESILVMRKRGQELLVDGHAVLETSAGLVDISQFVGTSIAFDGIITIIDDVVAIGNRRSAKDRYRSDTPLAEIQRQEMTVAYAWAKKIGAKFCYITSGDVAAFAKFLDSLKKPTATSVR